MQQHNESTISSLDFIGHDFKKKKRCMFLFVPLIPPGGEKKTQKRPGETKQQTTQNSQKPRMT